MGGTIVNGERTGYTLREPSVQPETSLNMDIGYRVATDNWTFSGTWSPGADDPANNTAEFLVTGVTTLTLTAAQIRTAQLYEFSAPDNLADSGSAFSQVAGSYIAANATENAAVATMGYTSFMSFKHLDIMIQQKTNVPNSTGYGPGRMVRVNIQDT